MLYDEDSWEKEVFDVVEHHVTAYASWQASDDLSTKVEDLKSYTLDKGDCAFLQMYPDASELYRGPLLPIPCLHRIHLDTLSLTGAHKIQESIGMSLPLSEVEHRLRRLSQLVLIVGLYRGQQGSGSRKALVTVDDGFRDALLLQPIFEELSSTLQPVLFVPSAILRDGDEGMNRRHLPLTCLYAHCFTHGIDPNDESKLFGATRSVLKTFSG